LSGGTAPKRGLLSIINPPAAMAILAKLAEAAKAGIKAK
jgi:hypothetical protein